MFCVPIQQHKPYYCAALSQYKTITQKTANVQSSKSLCSYTLTSGLAALLPGAWFYGFSSSDIAAVSAAVSSWDAYERAAAR